MPRLRLSVALALLWSLAVLVGLSLPGDSARALNLFTHDKFIHFGCFMGIAALWIWAYPVHWRRVAGLALLAAWLTEPYQGLLPWASRQPDPIDAMANTLGLITGTTLAWYGYVRPGAPLRDRLGSWPAGRRKPQASARPASSEGVARADERGPATGADRRAQADAPAHPPLSNATMSNASTPLPDA